MLTGIVNPEDFVEYLQHRMRIQCASDFSNMWQVTIDELTQTHIVFYGTISRPTTDEQFIARNTECILDINKEETRPKIVLGCGAILNVALPT